MIKKKICFLLIVIMILVIHTNALAFDLDTSVNLQMLEENKIEISLKLSDLADYANGINVVSGKLRVDSDVFDNVSFTGMNNWTCAYNNEKGNENKGKFILMTTSGNVKSDIEVAKIKLELKHNINNIQTKIKIQDIETSYQSEKIYTDEKEIKFKITDNSIKLVEDNFEENDKTEEKNIEPILDNSLEENNILAEKKDNHFVFIFVILAIIILIIVVILIINMKRRGKIEK